MRLAEAIIRRLLADAEIARDTAGEVVEGRRLEALPAITVQIVIDPRPQHMKGFQRVRPSAAQIDVWGRTAAEAGALAERCVTVLAPPALIDGVQFQRATNIATRSGGEPEQSGQPQRQRAQLHRESIDITFTHNAN